MAQTVRNEIMTSRKSRKLLRNAAPPKTFLWASGEYLTVTQAALAMGVHRSTVYRGIEEELIPVVERAKGGWLIPREAIDLLAPGWDQ
jgi:excisionase family DNA binding protein